MTDAPLVTDDPVVAAVYGALAYPSQRPALSTATDLVAGQPGPWELANPEQAALAVQLVERMGEARPPTDLLAAVVASGVVEACRMARVALTEFHTVNEALLSVPTRHEIEQLEARLVEFTKRHADGIELADPAPAPDESLPPTAGEVPGEVPTIEEATAYRVDQWFVLLRTRGLSVPDTMSKLRAAAIDAGKTSPASLSQVIGKRHLVEMLLAIIAAGPARPAK